MNKVERFKQIVANMAKVYEAKNKNGAEDIRKIKHCCDLILKLQYNEYE